MIEYALLFALGFLAAVLLGMVFAPIVQRRIVRFAEDRLKATMPLSPQEVRAQKDAARAVYAAENARIAQALNRERSRTTAIMLAREEAVQAARKLERENGELKAHIDALDRDAVTLRGAIRQFEHHIDRLKTALAKVEEEFSFKAEEATLLTRQLDKVSGEIEILRDDLRQRDEDAEALRTHVARLREERRSLRDAFRLEGERAKGAELRAGELEGRNALLDSQMVRAAAALADRDGLIERRGAEIERLLGRARETAVELRDLTRLLREAGIPLPERAARAGDGSAPPTGEADTASADAPGDASAFPALSVIPVQLSGDPVPELPVGQPLETDGMQSLTPPPVDGTPDPLPVFAATIPVADLVEERGEPLSEESVRDHAARFVERLMTAAPEEDADLREELAVIGAKMTVLTARREGATSPIPELLDRLDGVRADGRLTLAQRSRALLAAAEGEAAGS